MNRRLLAWGASFGLLLFVPWALTVAFPSQFEVSVLLDRFGHSTSTDVPRQIFLWPVLLLAVGIGRLALVLGTIGIQVALARRAQPSDSLAAASRSAWFAGPILVLGVPASGIAGTVVTALVLLVAGAVIGALYGRRRLTVT